MDRIRPWQVWWATFDPDIGREQAGRRPAIVVGSSFACSLPNGLVYLAPCTTKDRGLPFHPRIDALEEASFVLCDQVKAVSQQRLLNVHPARLSTEEIDRIKFVLRRMIDV